MSAEYSVEEVRARFEAAMCAAHFLFTWDDVDAIYEESSMRWAWLGFQAAYAKRIEADESAAPVGEVRTDGCMHFAYIPMSIPDGTKLFTYPPAQAAQVDAKVVVIRDGQATTADPATHPHSPDAADSGRVDLLNGEMLQAGADALDRFVAWESSNDEERYACIEAVWRAMQERAPTAALAAQGQGDSDGMCNLDNPERRCVCREEFGHRVCEPASPVVVPDGWISDPDTIPNTLIDACRDAICREFGNNGTDGYYKRILAKVFSALAVAPQPGESHE